MAARQLPTVSVSMPSFNANSPYEKIISAIVNRIKTKLPCNTGISVSVLEQDEAFNQAVTTLVHLSRHRLDHITMTLCDMLNKMHEDAQGRDNDLTYYQSQLLLTKILASAMAFRWDAHREDMLNPESQKPMSPIGTRKSQEKQTAGSAWVDPPPLDEKVARYAMSVMVVFIKQTGSWGDRPKASGHIHSDTLYDYETVENPMASPSSAMKSSFPVSDTLERKLGISASRRTASISALTPSYGPAYPFANTGKVVTFNSPMLASTVASVNALISKYINKIIYYISASNWPVVFARIRQKIHHFASGSEELQDNTDMKLLSYCAMDQMRLVQLFQELSSLLVSMKREAQSSISLSLRNAVWNWIGGFPEQFGETIVSHRKLEGAPERVFDTLYQMMQEPGSLSANRRIIWPTLTALLATSPERLQQSEEAMTGYTSGQRSNSFLSTVSSTLLNRDAKQSDIAMVCYLDLCKAAIHLPVTVGHATLRALAPDLADELRSRIMSPPQPFKPFYESHEPIDVNLYADVLVVIYRFNPYEVSKNVLLTCLNSESDAVKTCVVRCLVTLVSESKKFHAQPPIDPLYSVFATRLRVLFLGILHKHHNDPSSRHLHGKSARPTAKKYGTDFYSDSNLLLLTLLTLYRLDPMFYFQEMEERSETEVMKEVIVMLSPHQDATIQAIVAKTIHTLASTVMAMYSEDPLFPVARQHIHRLGLGLLVATSIGAMMSRDNTEQLRAYLSLTNMVLYNLELGLLDVNSAVWSNDGIVQMRLAVATACFTTLPTAQMDISVLASRAVRTMNLRQVPKPKMPTQVFAKSDEEDKARALMEAIGDPKTPVLGRISFQRRIRSLLRQGSKPNIAQAAGWAECYGFWISINTAYTKAMATPGHIITEEKKIEWQNYTLFLASYCGGNFMDRSVYPKTPIVFATLASWFASEDLPERFKTQTDYDALMREFIASLIDLLVHENLGVRETAKEALGSESQLQLFSMIVLQLDSVLTRLLERRIPDWNPVNTQILADQTISVLKLLVDRVENVVDSAHINVDMSHIILQLAGFLNSWPNTLDTIRVKTKFCSLCHSLFSKPDILVVKKGAIVRNSLLDSIHQWVTVTSSEWSSNEKELLAKKQVELDCACVQTAATLLDRLKLQALDGSTGAESGLAISRLFTKYLNFFVGALEKAVATEDSLSEMGSLRSRLGGTLTKDQGNIREQAIAGISNMLMANMDIGLKHCLIYGYHDDSKLRGTFLLIFTRVLRLGGRFDGVEAITTQPKQRRLCEMVRGDILLALAICETCPVSEIDVMLPVMINIFDTRTGLLALLKAVIDKEISRTDSPTDLFRANTMCARLLASVARVQGYNYLRAILAPLLEEMGHYPVERRYDLDPSKMNEADLEDNLNNIKRMAQMFLDVITSSATMLPPLCREVCAYIADRVSSQWVESKYSAVGGFLFLRFICPAIVTPETVDLSYDPSIRKGLLLITKIIQNLANNVLFGKVQFMMVLNTFLEDNILSVTHFLSEVVTLPEYDVDEPEEWHGASYDEADSIVLHRFFHLSADKVGKELLSFSRVNAEEEGIQTGKQTWDNLCSTLVEMGQPVIISPPSKEIAAQHMLYQEFMHTHEHRPVDHVKELFAPLPTPPDVSPVYAFLLNRVKVESVELDVLIMHIFKTLASRTGAFDVVIDCTGFTSSSEIPILWLKVFFERCPQDFVQGFQRAFILNANNAALKFLRKLYHITATTPIAKSVHSIASLEVLKRHIPAVTAQGMSHAMSLESERAVSYSPVAQQSRHGMRLPISLSVCETHIRILTHRSQPIWPGLECHVNEIILLGDIGDVYNVSTGHEANEFILRRSRYGGALYFSSPERDSIVHAIRTAKGRLRAENVQSYERTYSQDEISATLLNVSLLNLGVEDEALRSTAYDLACAVAHSLHYDDSKTIPIDGGFVPANPLALATHISDKLAVHSPTLTFDVITEFARGFHKSSASHKAACIYYLTPWIKNLSTFPDLTNSHGHNSGGRLRETFRILIELLVNDLELVPVFHKTIWAEIAHLEPGAISIALDELVRAATDGGLGSRRCESVADTIVVISSISVRGKILSKLRKAIGKTNLRPSQALTANNAWNEVAAIARLALYSGYNSRNHAHNQLFVSETVHLITLLAGSGPVLMRTTIHGMAINLLQSLYVSKVDDPTVGPKLKLLLEEAHDPTVLALFGLVSTGPSRDYSLIDTTVDTLSVNALEELSLYLNKVLVLGAQSSTGSNLINVWRARWMSLIISTAFHVSYIQPRAFVVMGVLATSDVDDDLLYQILVAFKNALASSVDTDTSTAVGILRCITKVVPATPRNGRYLSQIVWLAIALMEYGHVAFFAEAAALLEASVATLDEQGAFGDQTLSTYLLESRGPLDDAAIQIDEFVGLSFENSFSFTLASIVFRGLRHSQLQVQQTTTSLLGTLLRLATRTAPPPLSIPRAERTISPEVLGYFLALIPTTPTVSSFQLILREAGAGSAWLDNSSRSTDSEDSGAARIPLQALGIQDSNAALLVATFLGTMLNSATANPEREMLFSLLADMATVYPETISQIYESIQERVIDAFSNVANPAILAAVGVIFRASMLDAVYQQMPSSRLNGSNSTIGTLETIGQQHAGRVHLALLDDMQMRGMLTLHQFPSRSGANQLLQYMVEMITRIIE